MKQRSRSKNKIKTGGIGRIFRLVGKVLFILVLLTAAVLAVTIFFRIEAITVEGSTKYAAEQITSGMSVKKGDNLYLFNKIELEKTLLRRFPYLETVQIRRKLPDTLTVTVTECEAIAAIPSGGGFFLVSGRGKVLEQCADEGGYPLITGASLMGCDPGDSIDPAKDAYSDALITVLNTLESVGMLEDINFINIQSLTDVRIGIMNRFDIRVGTVDSLAYRLRFVMYVISERLSPSDVGRISWDAKGRLHFVPDTIENVRKSGLGSVEEGAADISEPEKEPEQPLEVIGPAESTGEEGETGTGEEDESYDNEEAPSEEDGSYDDEEVPSEEDGSYDDEEISGEDYTDYSEDDEYYQEDEEDYSGDDEAYYDDEEDYSEE